MQQMSEHKMIPEPEQQETDFDWFGLDENGCVGHFTTAGFKLLPKSVSANVEDLRKITRYFDEIGQTGAGCNVNRNLEKEVGHFKNETERSRYLFDFCRMADKGLYSFDIDTYVRPGIAYFCVAVPSLPLKLESLPPIIRAIIGRTFLKGIQFAEISRIDYEFTLNL
jgi:hypothetical protein